MLSLVLLLMVTCVGSSLGGRQRAHGQRCPVGLCRPHTGSCGAWASGQRGWLVWCRCTPNLGRHTGQASWGGGGVLSLQNITLQKISVQFAQHEINHFKANASVAFSSFTVLCNHPLYLVPEHFHRPKSEPHTHGTAWKCNFTFPSLSPPQVQPLATTTQPSVSGLTYSADFIPTDSYHVWSLGLDLCHSA